jgi:hypothetical protein
MRATSEVQMRYGCLLRGDDRVKAVTREIAARLEKRRIRLRVRAWISLSVLPALLAVGSAWRAGTAMLETVYDRP